MRFGDWSSSDSAPASSWFSIVGDWTWWTLTQLTRILALESTVLNSTGAGNSTEAPYTPLPATSNPYALATGTSGVLRGVTSLPSHYLTPWLTDSGPFVPSQLWQTTSHNTVPRFLEAARLSSENGAAELASSRLRGSRKLVAACPVTLSTSPSTLQYTENANLDFGVTVTQTFGGCFSGSLISTSFVVINPSAGKISKQDGSSLGTAINYGNVNTGTYTFSLKFLPTLYSTEIASIYTTSSSDQGGQVTTVLTISGIQIRISLEIIGSPTLPDLTLTVGSNPLYQLPLDTSVLNYNKYPLVVSTNSTLPWLQFLNNQTGLITFNPSGGQQGAYTVFFKVQSRTDSTNFVTFKASITVANRVPTAGSFLIPVLPYGTPLNTTVPMTTLFTDGDGITDLCPTGAPPCRISLLNAPSGMRFSNLTGELFFQPTSAGAYTAALVARDSAGATAITPISATFNPSLSSSNTNITAFNQGTSISLTGLSVSSPASSVTYTLSVNDASKASFAVNATAPGVVIIQTAGQVSFSGSPAIVNAYFAATPPRLVGSLVNRSPITLAVNVEDSLGQTLSNTKLITVNPVDHPLTATSVLPSVTNTVPTQATSVTVAALNIGNIDSVLWKITGINVTHNGTVVASNTSPNGWVFSGLNSEPTNQQAQLIITPPAGSQKAAYALQLNVQSVDAAGLPLPGMPALSLPTSTFSVASAAISVPPAALSNIGVGETVRFTLPRATTTGDTLIDEVTLPSGWSYNATTCEVTATATSSGPVTLIRKVSPTNDPTQSTVQTYTVVAVPTLSVTAANITSLEQGQTTTLSGLSVNTPASSATYILTVDNPSKGDFLVNTTTPGITIIQTAGQVSFSGAPGLLNAYFRNTPPKLVGSTTNRLSLSLTRTVSDSLGQVAPSAQQQIMVNPVNHPFTATSIIPTVSNTIPTQATFVAITAANLNNIDNELWVVTGFEVLNSTGTVIASNTNPNGWAFSGLNATPTNQQAQLRLTPPTGSQSSGLSLRAKVQAVTSEGVPIAGMPTLSLPTSSFDVASGAINVPAAALNNIGVGQTVRFTLPRATTTGDTLVDHVSLPSGWSYNATTCEVTATATSAGPVTLIREVNPLNDPSARIVQTYTVVAVSTLSASGTNIADLIQGQTVELTGLSVNTPAPSVTYTLMVDSLSKGDFSANTTTPGVTVNKAGPQISFSGSPAALNAYFLSSPPKFIPSVTNRLGVTLTRSVRDSLDQSISDTQQQLTVAKVNHPFTATGSVPTVSNTIPTQATFVTIVAGNINNIDNELWTVIDIEIVSSNGTVLAGSTERNGWTFTGLNSAPTNQQAQLTVTPPAGSQATGLSLRAKIQAVAQDGSFLSGMPVLSLATRPFSIATGQITVPTMALPVVGVNQNVTVSLPAATLVGDRLTDTITNLPEGWAYAPETRQLSMRPTGSGTVILARSVCAEHDATTCTTQTYAITVVPTIVVTGTMTAKTGFIGHDFSFSLPRASSPVGYTITMHLEDTAGNLVPAWLQPDALSGLLSSTVPADAVAIYNLVPVYTDQAGNTLRLAPFSLSTQPALQVQVGVSQSLLQNTAAELPLVSYTYGGPTATLANVSFSVPRQAGLLTAPTNNIFGFIRGINSAEGTYELTLVNVPLQLQATLPRILLQPTPTYFGIFVARTTIVTLKDPRTDKAFEVTVIHVNQPPRPGIPFTPITLTDGDLFERQVVTNVAFEDTDLSANVGEALTVFHGNSSSSLGHESLTAMGINWDPRTQTYRGFFPSPGSYTLTPCVHDTAGLSICNPISVTVNEKINPSFLRSAYERFQDYQNYVGIGATLLPFAYYLLRLVKFSIAHRISSRQSAILLTSTILERDAWKQKHTHEILTALRITLIEATNLMLEGHELDRKDEEAESEEESDDETASQASSYSEGEEEALGTAAGVGAMVSAGAGPRTTAIVPTAASTRAISATVVLTPKEVKERKLQDRLHKLTHPRKTFTEEQLLKKAQIILRSLLKGIIKTVEKDRIVTSGPEAFGEGKSQRLDLFQRKVACLDRLVAVISLIDPQVKNIPRGFEDYVLEKISYVGAQIRGALIDGDSDEETQNLTQLYLTMVEYLFYIKSYQHRQIEVDLLLTLLSNLLATPGIRIPLYRKLINKILCRSRSEESLPIELKLTLKTTLATLSRFTNDDSLLKILMRLTSALQAERQVFTPLPILWQDQIERLRFKSILALTNVDRLIEFLNGYLAVSDTNPHLLQAYQTRLDYLNAFCAAATAEHSLIGFMVNAQQISHIKALLEVALDIRRRMFFIINSALPGGQRLSRKINTSEASKGFTTAQECLAKLVAAYEKTFAVTRNKLIEETRLFYVAALTQIAKQHPRRDIRLIAFNALNNRGKVVTYTLSESLTLFGRGLHCCTTQREHKKHNKSLAMLRLDSDSSVKVEESLTHANPMLKGAARKSSMGKLFSPPPVPTGEISVGGALTVARHTARAGAAGDATKTVSTPVTRALGLAATSVVGSEETNPVFLPRTASLRAGGGGVSRHLLAAASRSVGAAPKDTAEVGSGRVPSTIDVEVVGGSLRLVNPLASVAGR